MTTQRIGVTGGVDTHSNTHDAAAIDEVGRLLGAREFTADPAGYEQLLGWLQSFGTLTQIGVEGTGCYGAGLTRFLRRRAIDVIEVNRPDRRSRRIRGKSDPLDAESAARRALAEQDQVIPKDTTTIVESIRVLRIDPVAAALLLRHPGLRPTATSRRALETRNDSLPEALCRPPDLPRHPRRPRRRRTLTVHRTITEVPDQDVPLGEPPPAQERR
jgi:hypothetical protein